MYYIDGFVVPVPRKKLPAYRRMAIEAVKVWREYGALEYHECEADDVKQANHTSSPMGIELRPGETVILSWIVYRSRAQRDRANAKAAKDPRLAFMMNPKARLFDGNRMFWGGFKEMVDL